MTGPQLARALILVTAAALVFGFFALDLHQYLTLNGMKAGLGQLEAQRAASPLGLGLAFFAVYVVATALSIPGVLVLTLAASALFGLVMGTVIVSFASSAGATLAFLASRYLLRDAIQSRFGERLKAMKRTLPMRSPNTALSKC